MLQVVLVVAFGLTASACTNLQSVAADAAPSGEGRDGVVLTRGLAAPPTSLRTAPSQPSISLGFVGDVQMVESMLEAEPLAAVADLLSAPDLTFANLETVISDADEVGRPPIDKEFIFRSPPETLDQMFDAGTDVVALANNHAWDYGPLGTGVTRAHVDASRLVGVGAGPDPAVAYAPRYLDIHGQTVGVVSLSRVPCDWAGDEQADRPEIAWACDRFAGAAVEAIAEAEAGADHTVVMLHRGTELADCPDNDLRAVIDEWVGIGADVISISHPHVLQGVELVDGAAVLWSTGNFAFQNGGGRTARSALFEVTLGGERPAIRVHPTMLPGGVASPADPDTADAVFEEISARSVGGRIGADGVLLADPGSSLCDGG